MKTLIVLFIFSVNSYGQVSFNDLMIISELKQGELVNGLLIENNFTYKGRVDKDKEGWSVDTWSFSNGTAWLEYKKIREPNKETGDIEELCMAIFYTTSTNIYNSILSEMKSGGWSIQSKQLTGENMDGFSSYLYYGEKTLYYKMKGVLVGENKNYRGTTVYRFLIL